MADGIKQIGLGICPTKAETPLETALRYAKRYGLEEEVRFCYDRAIGRGADECQAAWEACMEWDICEPIIEYKSQVAQAESDD